MTIIYVLLAAHFIADFVCQSDWMANHKSKRWDALALHVLIYGGAVALCVGAYEFAVGGSARPWLWLWVNLAAHFVQDAITSRITSRLWFLKMTPMTCDEALLGRGFLGRINHLGHIARPAYIADTGTRHWFFVAIGADQLLHYVTLFVTAGWWLK